MPPKTKADPPVEPTPAEEPAAEPDFATGGIVVAVDIKRDGAAIREELLKHAPARRVPPAHASHLCSICGQHPVHPSTTSWACEHGTWTFGQ